MTSVKINFGGEELALLGERAVWWARARTLFVADLHLGKAATFQSLGVPIPEGHTRHDLDRLSMLIERFQARRLFILGDLLHARSSRVELTMQALGCWRDRHSASRLHVTLVRGNHDVSAGDPPSELGFEVVDEPSAVGLEPGAQGISDAPGRLLAAHSPEIDRPVGTAMLCGHLHPAVALSAGRGGGAGPEMSMRPACFWIRAVSSADGVCVLPAFGTFTGGRAIRPQVGDRVFAVGPSHEHGVVEIKGVHKARPVRNGVL